MTTFRCEQCGYVDWNDNRHVCVSPEEHAEILASVTKTEESEEFWNSLSNKEELSNA